MNKGKTLSQTELLKESAISTPKAFKQEATPGNNDEIVRGGSKSRQEIEALISDWPAVAKTVAEQTMKKFGPPHEATESLLLWHKNGLWKRTIIYRDEIPHYFPEPHIDVIEQYIDYKVPVEKFSEIGAFDGSVIIDRTRGEVAARCDKEEANFLTINLVHEIVTGKRTVEDARLFYSETTAALLMGKGSPYLDRFLFELPTSDSTADVDETTIGKPMLDQVVEKVKDVGRKIAS